MLDKFILFEETTEKRSCARLTGVSELLERYNTFTDKPSSDLKTTSGLTILVILSVLLLPLSKSPKSINDSKPTPDEIIISFERGDPVSINQKKLKAHELLSKLNEYGFNHGIGREDIVENRFVGMKSRGVYETPGGTILSKAHRAIESITLDRGAAHLKDEIMPKYAETIYNGLWFSSERTSMQSLIDVTQKKVTGDVRLQLFKGNVIVKGRRSPFSKYNLSLVSFDEVGDYNQRDAEGFIKINSLRLKH